MLFANGEFLCFVDRNAAVTSSRRKSGATRPRRKLQGRMQASAGRGRLTAEIGRNDCDVSRASGKNRFQILQSLVRLMPAGPVI
jgi:hypothetical protein